MNLMLHVTSMRLNPDYQLSDKNEQSAQCPISKPRTSAGWSAWSVDAPTMLNPVDQNDLVLFEDLVDDAVVAAPCGAETLESTDQQLSRFAVLVKLAKLPDRPSHGRGHWFDPSSAHRRNPL